MAGPRIMDTARSSRVLRGKGRDQGRRRRRPASDASLLRPAQHDVTGSIAPARSNLDGPIN